MHPFHPVQYSQVPAGRMYSPVDIQEFWVLGVRICLTADTTHCSFHQSGIHRSVQMLYKYKYGGTDIGENRKIFNVNGLKPNGKFDKFKIIAVENMNNIKPVTQAFESIREE